MRSDGICDYTVKAELAGFINGVKVGMRKRGVKDDSKGLGARCPAGKVWGRKG